MTRVWLVGLTISAASCAGEKACSMLMLCCTFSTPQPQSLGLTISPERQAWTTPGAPAEILGVQGHEGWAVSPNANGGMCTVQIS
jgi:hypothetical protein